MLTKEQLLERRNYLGGSEAGAIAGFNKYCTPLKVYNKKIDDNPELEEQQAIYMHWGNVLEPALATEYEYVTGNKVLTGQPTKFHPKYPFLAANIDGMLEDGTIIEFKSCTFWGRKRWEGNNIPTEYICQCAQYAMIYDAPKVDLVLFKGTDQPLFIHTYKRDRKFEDLLLAKLVKFWQTNVMERQPPEPTTFEEVINHFLPSNILDATTSKLVSSSSIYDTVYDIKDLQTKKEILEEKIKTRKVEVMKYMGYHNLLLDNGGEDLCTWKAFEVTRFHQSSFKVDYPDLYIKYLKKSTYRRFVVKVVREN